MNPNGATTALSQGFLRVPDGGAGAAQPSPRRRWASPGALRSRWKSPFRISLLWPRCMERHYTTGMSATSLIVFAVVVAAGSLFQGLLGFGAALVAAPLALVFVEKAIAVPALTVAGLALNAFLVMSIREPMRGRILVPLIWSSLIGVPAGLLILTRVPLSGLQIGAGLLSVTFAILISRSSVLPGSSLRLAPLAGALSGALSTSTSMGGPPVVLLLAHGRLPRDEYRRTLAGFFLYAGAVSMVFFAVGGVFSTSALVYGLVAVPGAVIGGLGGHRVSVMVPHEHFRAIALGAVGLTGVVAVAAGLAALR